MKEKIYITTSIPYVNSKPHMGHALELVQADAVARFHRLEGRKIVFQTGSDENAFKNVLAAREQGLTTCDLVDRNARFFRDLNEALDISADTFIRTTDPDHQNVVRMILRKVNDGGDIYFKGAWILHTLRYLVGDSAFFRAMRRLAYPDPRLEEVVDGRQTHFANTEDFVLLAERESDRDLDWFFEVYLRQPRLPSLLAQRSGGTLELRWQVPLDLPFPMPIDVQLGDEVVRVSMPDGRARIEVPEGVGPNIDTHGWVLRARDGR